jgi:hypothetical protein
MASGTPVVRPFSPIKTAFYMGHISGNDKIGRPRLASLHDCQNMKFSGDVAVFKNQCLSMSFFQYIQAHVSDSESKLCSVCLEGFVSNNRRKISEGKRYELHLG